MEQSEVRKHTAFGRAALSDLGSEISNFLKRYPYVRYIWEIRLIITICIDGKISCKDAIASYGINYFSLNKFIEKAVIDNLIYVESDGDDRRNKTIFLK